ncbi:mitochondrial fission ELM1 family protein [Microbulbifer sp. TYP-18]|uniref:mitochondrial fission ELM1 family protein n=1 Tax=Microbulbifer sp. TYP-18 TaxID=3230024 RepID=UPI0034C626EC
MQLTIWRFLDGNRAHEKQSAALISGLRDCIGDTLDCYDIAPLTLFQLLRRGLPAELQQLPLPHFIVGAGHRSHWPMLLARRRFGGRSVVIMKPSLPLCWFDFAIIPEHDRPPALANVIVSQGALTEPLPAGPTVAGRGLILLGGPSKHFRWDGTKVQAVVEKLLQMPGDWIVSDSRRTPLGVLERLRGSGGKIFHWRDCPPDWLAEQLAQAERIWVTGDSISMLFEALQSRAQVGVIALPSRRRNNKVRAAVQRLLDQEMLVDALALEQGECIKAVPREPLAQQRLCARALLRRSGMVES